MDAVSCRFCHCTALPQAAMENKPQDAHTDRWITYLPPWGPLASRLGGKKTIALLFLFIWFIIDSHEWRICMRQAKMCHIEIRAVGMVCRLLFRIGSHWVYPGLFILKLYGPIHQLCIKWWAAALGQIKNKRCETSKISQASDMWSGRRNLPPKVVLNQLSRISDFWGFQ